MGKAKALPSVEADVVAESKNDEMPVVARLVEVPMATLRHGHEPRAVYLAGLTGKQRGNIRRLVNGLIAEGQSLENGKLVASPQDAVKYLLEQL